MFPEFLQRALLTFALVILPVLGGMAQPANNDFANAWTLIGASASTNGNSGGATKEPGEPNHAGFNGGRSVWFNWTAPSGGVTRLATAGSGFNTLLAVYTGSSVSALTSVASNDNSPDGGNTSQVDFSAQAGTTYRIAIDGRNFFGNGASSGDYDLNLRILASVDFTSPTNGALFLLGTPIPLEVTASVPGGSVTRIDFYRNNTLLGSDAQPPYSLVVSNAAPGTNTFYAVVVDNNGQLWPSAPLNIAVLTMGVNITDPPDGSLYANNDPIRVAALGYLTSGPLTNVEFFVDGQKFGEDTASPFSVTWTGVTPGSHRFTASGKDNTGSSYLSPAVAIAVAETLVSSNSVWKYLDNGSDQGTAWVAPDFDDSSWASGPAELGYGDGPDNPSRPEATMVSYGNDPQNKYITTYFRHSFVVTNAAGYSDMLIQVLRDDGAVVYLNGVEVGRFNMPDGPVNYLTTAPNASDDGMFFFPALIPVSLLVDGTNVLAVEIHQTNPTSSDISFDLDLRALPIIIRNLPPLVALTSPSDQDHFLAPSSLTLSADASDSDGSVSNVQFYADGILIGEDMTAPYSIRLEQSARWLASPAGCGH